MPSHYAVDRTSYYLLNCLIDYPLNPSPTEGPQPSHGREPGKLSKWREASAEAEPGLQNDGYGDTMASFIDMETNILKAFPISALSYRPGIG